jgi:hypothetical protein
MITEEQRKQYLQKLRKSSSFGLFAVKSLSANMQAKFGENEGAVINFYGEISLFIRARGVIQENRLNMTIVSFPEDACPL